MLPDFIEQGGEGFALPYPAERWEEGTLIGNGKQGAIILGGAEREEIILSHERLFAPVYTGLKPIPMAEELPYIRNLLKQRKYKEASLYIMDMFNKQEGRQTKCWTNPFIPAADLFIETIGVSHYRNYNRTLDFPSGEAEVSFQAEGWGYKRSAFYSRAADCMVMKLKAEKAADYSIKFTQHPYRKDGRKVLHLMFPMENGEYLFEPEVGTKKQCAWYLSGFKGRENGYGVVCYVADCDGSIEETKDTLMIRDAKHILLLVQVFLIDDRKQQDEQLNEVIKRLDEEAKQMKTSYKLLLDAHRKIHTERFERIALSLSECRHLESIFNAGRYAILSSSGDTPPNLQGIWTGTYDTGWSSDYTQNGNLQTAIMGLLPSGDFESMESYFSYQESLLNAYRENSRILYGCRGIHVPSRTSDSGYDFHFDLTWPMIFWTAGAAWVSHFYYDYWLYTGDDDFFIKRALPFMKESALFYEDYLIEDEEGYWMFTPSYSPENTPSNSDNAACVNATMDIAVAKELFMNLIVGCSTLGIEQEEVIRWKGIMEKMPPYKINEDGALKEWAAKDLLDCYDHRHSSHLYMLYYDIPWYESEEVLKACKKAYELKMKYKKEEQGTMAFGLVQAGMAAAHLGDSEMAETMIMSMAENNYFRTYASAHDYGPSIFNTDISGGMPGLMLETIAQSSPIIDENMCIEAYQIRLLPALPSIMKSGKVKGMCLRGGFKLNMEWQEGQVVHYEIINPFHRKYIM